MPVGFRGPAREKIGVHTRDQHARAHARPTCACACEAVTVAFVADVVDAFWLVPIVKDE
jgi:hypothetical protein